jgi:hypothetical protein
MTWRGGLHLDLGSPTFCSDECYCRDPTVDQASELLRKYGHDGDYIIWSISFNRGEYILAKSGMDILETLHFDNVAPQNVRSRLKRPVGYFLATKDDIVRRIEQLVRIKRGSR